MFLNENIFLFEKLDKDEDVIKRIDLQLWKENLVFKKFLLDGIDDNFKKEDKLGAAIACLLAFVQDNFTGPSISTTIEIGSGCEEKLKSSEKISVDGIEFNENIQNIPLLLIAERLISNLSSEFPSDLLISIWHMRVLKVFQRSLDEESHTLYERFKEIHKQLTAEKLQQIQCNRTRFLIQLEVISIYLLYRRISIAGELINNLQKEFGIEVLEEGVLGKRTKWQEKSVSQFHVSIKQENLFESAESTHGNCKLPELLKLEDDTRLEITKFNDDSKNELQTFSSAIQNFLLLCIRFKELSQPKDKLADEEIKPYLMMILHQSHGPWSVRLEGLLMNIKSESSHSRTIDRSLRQCEDIVNMIDKNHDNEEVVHRMSYIFSTLMTPRYKMRELLAGIMISLGLVKAALDVYLSIHHWEEVINCYTRLDLRHKAAEIIQQELSKRPTVKLYCLLGDATDDLSYYEKAWNFSKERSGLAQRQWGMFFFAKHQYEEAIPHLQKSLEINSLQEKIWLRLGFAALTLEKYELASSAYIRYTQLEPNGFESWNNLAKCFIKLGNKQRAHKVLQEALKCNYDNWKIWENFLLVSIDIGSFEDALNAYNRLIELKEKYFDEEVLSILVRAVASKKMLDNEGNSSSRLRKKTLELLAHLGSIHINEGIVWELSSLLEEDQLKRSQKLFKAYKGYVLKSPDWTKDEKNLEKILNLLLETCVASLQAAENFKESEKMLLFNQIASTRLPAMGAMSVARKSEWESCKNIVLEMEPIVEKMQEKLKQLKP